MANIISGVFSGVRFLIENPLWALAIVIGIFLMPLEVFDILLYILVNIIVLLINVIIFILFTLFNIIVWGVNGIFTTIWSFLTNWGLSGSAPQMPLLDYTPQDYITINIFSPDKNLLIIILDVLGKSLPLW